MSRFLTRLKSRDRTKLCRLLPSSPLPRRASLVSLVAEIPPHLGPVPLHRDESRRRARAFESLGLPPSSRPSSLRLRVSSRSPRRVAFARVPSSLPPTARVRVLAPSHRALSSYPRTLVRATRIHRARPRSRVCAPHLRVHVSPLRTSTPPSTRPSSCGASHVLRILLSLHPQVPKLHHGMLYERIHSLCAVRLPLR